ncbi:MAG: histidine kinase dimerization/phosphoacceptor domain -containing protein [Sphingomicrobium sp.]
MLATSHPRQEERLASLKRYEILDTPREDQFDDIVSLVADICEAPVAVINFIDSDRQWFKAEVGLGVRSTPLETSLCSHVILERDFVEIPDTLDDVRMCDNPLCLADGGFRFYAGALLTGDGGLPLGTLCVLDTRPRTLSELQRRTIKVMADRVMTELNLRLALGQQEVLRREIDHRVKNSLASVGAIVNLQSSRSGSAEVREALDAVHSRIAALEALHEQIYRVGDNDGVDFGMLVNRCAEKLRSLIPDRIAITVDVDRHPLQSEEANAIVLTVNEFVTNSAKHAFPGSARGTIRIEGRSLGAGFKLMCSDDGGGDDSSLDRIEQSAGLGSRVIRALASSIRAHTHWSTNGPGIRLELVSSPNNRTG